MKLIAPVTCLVLALVSWMSANSDVLLAVEPLNCTLNVTTTWQHKCNKAHADNSILASDWTCTGPNELDVCTGGCGGNSYGWHMHV